MPESAHAARLSTFAALRERNYCLYWFGLVFYVLGHRAEYMTFAWIAWEVSRDPLTLGYLGLAQGVPLVLFQLFGGVLADRLDRLRMLLITQVLTAVTLGSRPTMAKIRQGLAGNLCRCTGYEAIYRAIHRTS